MSIPSVAVVDLRKTYDTVEAVRGISFQIEPGVLVGLVAGNGRDALYKVEDALRLSAFFSEHHLDDLGCFRLAEAALAQELGSFLVRARYNALSG